MNHIKIYGMGCNKFFETIKNTKFVLNTGKKKAAFSIVTDRNEIAKAGFTNLPAVIINNKLISQGDVLCVGKIEKELAG